MQPPSLHQPAQPINNSGDQVILAQVASKNEEEEDHASNYTGTSYDPSVTLSAGPPERQQWLPK